MTDFKCRICGYAERDTILDYCLPLSTLMQDKMEITVEKYSFRIVKCCNCNHFQLEENPDVKLYEDYLYTPRYAHDFVEFIDELVDGLDKHIAYKVEHPSAVEIGSSNGFLLGKLQEKGWKVLGVEPSNYLSKFANDEGINTIQGYFGDSLLPLVREQIEKPDIVIIRHLLEHIDSLNEFMGAVKHLVADGTLYVKVPYVKNIIEHDQFYGFYHEHLSYFSATTLDRLFRNVGLYIHRVYESKLEGGSVLVYANNSPEKQSLDNIDEYLLKEKTLFSEERIKKFKKNIISNIDSIRSEVKAYLANGDVLAGWGAGQRGCTVIAACGLEQNSLQYVIDINQQYWWKYIPGTDIQIVPPDYYKDHMVDKMLVFAGSYYDSIIKENPEFVKMGGYLFIRSFDGGCLISRSNVKNGVFGQSGYKISGQAVLFQ